jgi:uncharacterized protein YdeI (YjbR/CyaY-like superfamily)
MPAPSAKLDPPILEFRTDGDWEAWLGANHETFPAVWLKIAKRSAAASTVTHPEALDTAICFGWIDGHRRPLDETYYLQRFTPRGPRSKWSQVNCGKAEQLIATGRMRGAGLAQIEAARADGRWDAAYEPQSRATVPPDFQRALDAEPPARDFFDTLGGTRRYAFLYRLHHVNTPEARRRRIASYMELLRQGRTLN